MVNMEYGKEAILNNRMKASTKHFFYRNDTRNLSKSEIHQKANKFYGICTTRDRYGVGKIYGDIMFVFDKRKLGHKYKIIPYDFPGMIHVSRNSTSSIHSKYLEMEEFIIISSNPDKYLEQLDNYLVGFYLMGNVIDEQLLNHPLYMGNIRDNSREKVGADHYFKSHIDYLRKMEKGEKK